MTGDDHAPGLGARSAVLAVAVLTACGDGAADAGPAASGRARAIAQLVPGEEREVDAGVFMIMHRASATDPLGDGWHRAVSTEGGFAVEVPLPFNDFRIRSRARDEVEVRSHTIGGKTPGMLAWSATCIARRDGSLGPDAPPPSTDRVEAFGSPTRAYTRTVGLPGRTCVLTVEAQGSDPLPDETTRMRFLSSFQPTGAPRW